MSSRKALTLWLLLMTYNFAFAECGGVNSPSCAAGVQYADTFDINGSPLSHTVKLTHIPLVGTRIRVFWDGTEDLHASFARTAETLTFDAATDVRKPLMVVYQALGSDNDSINTEEPASSPTANNVARAAMDREAQRLNTNNGLGQSGININAARVNPVGDSAGASRGRPQLRSLMLLEAQPTANEDRSPSSMKMALQRRHVHTAQGVDGLGDDQIKHLTLSRRYARKDLREDLAGYSDRPDDTEERGSRIHVASRGLNMLDRRLDHDELGEGHR